MQTTRFYVTMIRDKRTAWLLGPYVNHETALVNLDRAREEANKADPWSHFDAFGTAARTAESHPWGVLMKHHDKDVAARPFASYRIPNPYGGWIMIGAFDCAEAMREAARSTHNPQRETLEIWDGEKYINALYFSGV